MHLRIARACMRSYSRIDSTMRLAIVGHTLQTSKVKHVLSYKLRELEDTMSTGTGRRREGLLYSLLSEDSFAEARDSYTNFVRKSLDKSP